MRTVPVLAGIAAGAALGLGAVVAADVATDDASARGGSTIADLRQEVQAANFRSQAAINGYKNINNVVGKHFTEPNSLTGARSGPIPQDRGIGGGLPGGLIADGAVSESKLDDGLKAKVNAGGPAGPAGPPGPQGPVGSPGVTNVSTTSAAPDPLPAGAGLFPIFPDPPVTIETSVAGRVLITVNFTLGKACGLATSSPVAWIVLDGEPVRSSYRRLPDDSTVAYAVTATGVTDAVVPAGTHQVHIAEACEGGGPSSLTSGVDFSVGAIVLG